MNLTSQNSSHGQQHLALLDAAKYLGRLADAAPAREAAALRAGAAALASLGFSVNPKSNGVAAKRLAGEATDEAFRSSDIFDFNA